MYSHSFGSTCQDFILSCMWITFWYLFKRKRSHFPSIHQLTDICIPLFLNCWEECCYEQSWTSFSGSMFSILWSNICKSRMAWLCIISMLNFLRDDQTGFHGKKAILIFLPVMDEFLTTSHIFKAYFLMNFFLLFCVHLTEGEVASHCGSDVAFPDD